MALGGGVCGGWAGEVGVEAWWHGDGGGIYDIPASLSVVVMRNELVR